MLGYRPVLAVGPMVFDVDVSLSLIALLSKVVVILFALYFTLGLEGPTLYLLCILLWLYKAPSV